MKHTYTHANVEKGLLVSAGEGLQCTWPGIRCRYSAGGSGWGVHPAFASWAQEHPRNEQPPVPGRRGHTPGTLHAHLVNPTLALMVVSS
eukprot:scaffold45440_cov23-Tisochrysis_lutea.AAC.1